MVGVRPAGRRLVWSAIACTALCLLVPRPAYADPATPVGIPDPGPPPVASAPLFTGTSPASTTSTIPQDVGPFAKDLFSLRSQVESLGERLTKVNLDVTAAHQSTSTTYSAWQSAVARAAQLRQRADDATAQAYKQATGLGPLDGYAGDLQQLGHLAPGLNDAGTGSSNTETILADADRASQLADTENQAYQSALLTEQQLVEQQTALNTQFLQQSQNLADLTARNAAAVAAADAQLQAADAQISGQFGAGTNTKGYSANPIALAALRYALSEVNVAWYQWGAAGPYKFDCSGLVIWSYKQAGYHALPRVANDQYHATTPVPTSELLPGDLLFFSTTSRTDWTAISHVGIYLGDNKMVEAPTAGQQVKIAPIWWSAFFGATRVVPAIPPAPAPPPPPPAPSPSSTPSPTPTSPSPSPSSPSPSPSGSPSPSPSDSPSPSHSPSPSPSPSPSHSPSPSPSPSAVTNKSTEPPSPSGSTSATN